MPAWRGCDTVPIVRTFPLRSLGALLASAVSTTASVPLATQTFRTSTELVRVYVTVRDDANRLVPNLRSQDFEIRADGVAQDVSLFSAEIQPVSTALLLDTSGSMVFSLGVVRDAATQFVARMLPRDRALLVSFGDAVTFTPGTGFTADRNLLATGLSVGESGGRTRLYDAISESLDRIGGEQQRRVLIVLTDGADNGSRSTSAIASSKARSRDVMVYAVGLTGDYLDGLRRVRRTPDGRLAALAAATGGTYLELATTDDLATTFRRISQEIHSQYLLAFSPAADNAVHQLEVRVRRPGLRAAARTSYQHLGSARQGLLR